MAYFHIDRAQRYIQSLGFGGRRPNGINDRTQVVVADAFPTTTRSSLPATRKIKYGIGGVDDAEDADVILHEYGHAIQDDQVRWFGQGDQAGAIGEGFGDYWAAVMSSRVTGDQQQGRRLHLRLGRRQLGEDSSPRSTAGAAGARTAATPWPRPRPSCASRQHPLCRGGLVERPVGPAARDRSPAAFDRIVLSSQFMYTTNERFDDAVEALIAADQASTAARTRHAICAEMEIQRGISVAGCP